MAHIFLIGFAITICILERSKGAAMSFGLWHGMCLFIALEASLSSDRPMEISEKITILFAYLMHYASSVIIILVSFNKAELKNIKLNTELNRMVTFYIFCLPLVTSSIAGGLKFIDDVKN